MELNLYRSKFQEAASRLDPDTRSLLDLGCRDGILKKYLPPEIDYSGVDLVAAPLVVKTCNVEDGIPFPDQAFDAVVALDMLEHTDNIWFVFEEMLRVAQKQIMMVLPNCYHWRARMRFVRGKEADKYKLSPVPIQDRHRWLTSYDTSHEFALHMAGKYRLAMVESIMVDDRKNILRESLARFLPKNLMSVAAFFTFSK